MIGSVLGWLSDEVLRSNLRFNRMIHAIVCGINSYRDRDIGTLRHACADATAFARLLGDGIEVQDRNITLLLDHEATKRGLMVAIGEDLHRRSKADDVVLLYFACHGSSETQNSLDDVTRYLI